MVEAGVNLRAIGRAGAGVDNIDVEAATERGIVVMNCTGWQYDFCRRIRDGYDDGAVSQYPPGDSIA